MKKRLFLAIGYTVLLGTVVHAETVTSGSKYPIVVEVYKGSADCKPNSRQLENIVSNAKKNFQRSGIWRGLKEGFNSVMYSSGCELIGKAIELPGIPDSSANKRGSDRNNPLTQFKNFANKVAQEVTQERTINLPIGAIILAYKEPIKTKQQYGKIVNPLPALCQVVRGKSITLETRKSEGLRGLIGMAGDAGLKCTFK